MNEVKLFENEEFGLIRTIDIDGKTWFVGNDVARGLEYTRPHEAVTSHCKGAVVRRILTNGGEQETKIIPEGDMYRLIIKAATQSNSKDIKEKAERFESWIFDEVLPSIRKNGGYISGQETLSDDELMEKAFLVAQKKIADRDKKIAEQSAEIEVMKPKAEMCDKLLDASMLANFRDAAKEIGISQTQFTGWLIDNGYVYMTSTRKLRPMEPYMKSEFFQMKPYQNPYNGYKGSRTYITGRGLAAFKKLIDTEGHNRDTMKKHGGKKSKNK